MTLTLAMLLTACALPEPIERNCLHRQAFYPDPDGDGIGDPSEVFVGCEAPQGWVSVLETPGGSGGSGATTTTTGATAATAATGRTGDTGLRATADTGPVVDTSDTATAGGSGATPPTGTTGDTGP